MPRSDCKIQSLGCLLGGKFKSVASCWGSINKYTTTTIRKTAVSFVRGVMGSRLCFCFFMLQEKRGGNMLGICHSHKRLNAI